MLRAAADDQSWKDFAKAVASAAGVDLEASCVVLNGDLMDAKHELLPLSEYPSPFFYRA